MSQFEVKETVHMNVVGYVNGKRVRFGTFVARPGKAPSVILNIQPPTGTWLHMLPITPKRVAVGEDLGL